MSNKARHTFESPEHLHAWLRENHASETELWVRIFKKGSGQPSVTWDDCVVAACWLQDVQGAKCRYFLVNSALAQRNMREQLLKP